MNLKRAVELFCVSFLSAKLITKIARSWSRLPSLSWDCLRSRTVRLFACREVFIRGFSSLWLTFDSTFPVLHEEGHVYNLISFFLTWKGITRQSEKPKPRLIHSSAYNGPAAIRGGVEENLWVVKSFQLMSNGLHRNALLPLTFSPNFHDFSVLRSGLFFILLNRLARCFSYPPHVPFMAATATPHRHT